MSTMGLMRLNLSPFGLVNRATSTSAALSRSATPQTGHREQTVRNCFGSFCFSGRLSNLGQCATGSDQDLLRHDFGNSFAALDRAEAKLYEKYGLDAKLINIPSGNTAISALVTGEVDIVSGSGSSSIVAAGRGLPVVIVGSFGSTTYKLDRKSTRLNSSHLGISYAVFC